LTYAAIHRKLLKDESALFALLNGALHMEEISTYIKGSV